MYDSNDASLSVLTPKSTKWCQMQSKACVHVKGQGQGKLLGPQVSVKCSSTYIRFSPLDMDAHLYAHLRFETRSCLNLPAEPAKCACMLYTPTE